MKKIMIVLPSLCGGGAERVTLNIANNLNIDKFNVTIVSCTGKNEYKGFVNENLNIVNLNKKKVSKCIFDLKSLIKSKQPDIVLCVMEHMYLVTLISKILSKVKCKIILATHNNYSSSIINSTNKLKTSLLDCIFKILKPYKYCDKILFVSKGSYKDFKNIFNIDNNKCKVIYNPVIFDSIESLKDDNVNLDEKFRYILSIGRLTKQKDHKTLIKSIDYIVNNLNIKNIRLIIVGKGELEEELKRQCEELNLNQYILFWGFENNPFKLMNKCDIFVLSSIYEGLPTVLIEAMNCGAIAISTDCPSGPNEIIDDGVNGYLVNVGDYIGIANKIVEVLNQESSINSRMRNLAILKSKDFHVRLITKEYEELFMEL